MGIELSKMRGKLEDASAYLSKLSIILTLVSIALLLYSMSSPKLVIGSLGFLNSLPAAFFVSISLLTLASAILWSSSRSNEKLLLFQICVLISALWLFPLRIGGIGASQPSVDDAFGEWALVEYLIHRGLNLQVSVLFTWPGFFIISAMVTEMTGIKDLNMVVALFPFLSQFAFLASIYLFFHRTIGNTKNYVWAAIWFFYIANWTDSGNFHPQYLAYFLLITLIAVFVSKQRNSSAQSISGILLFASLTITHFLTPFLGLGVMLMLYIVKRVKLSVLIITSTIFVTWLIYSSFSFLEATLPAMLKYALNLQLLWQWGLINPMAGSQSHTIIGTIRLITTAMFLIAGFLGLIISFRTKRFTDTDRAIIAIAFGFVLAGVITGANYYQELVMRLLPLGILVAAYFGTKLLKHKATGIFFCVLLLIGLPFQIVSRTGNLNVDYLAAGHFAGSSFFLANTIQGYYMYGSGAFAGSGQWNALGQMVPVYDYRFQPNGTNPYTFLTFLITDPGTRNIRPLYFFDDDRDRAMTEWIWGDPQILQHIEILVVSPTFDLVYMNPNMGIYLYAGSP